LIVTFFGFLSCCHLAISCAANKGCCNAPDGILSVFLCYFFPVTTLHGRLPLWSGGLPLCCVCHCAARYRQLIIASLSALHYCQLGAIVAGKASIINVIAVCTSIIATTIAATAITGENGDVVITVPYIVIATSVAMAAGAPIATT